MKKTMFVLMTASVSMMACSKSTTTPNNNTNTTPTPTKLSNEWEVKGTKYKMAYCMFIEPTMLAAMETMPSGSSTINSVSIYFKNKPKADGTYKLVFKADIDSLAADEAGVAVNIKASGAQYYSAGVDGATAKITVANGKVSVEIAEAKVFTVSPSADTTTLKAQFTEM